jgi:hypothetical protein
MVLFSFFLEPIGPPVDLIEVYEDKTRFVDIAALQVGTQIRQFKSSCHKRTLNKRSAPKFVFIPVVRLSLHCLSKKER